MVALEGGHHEHVAVVACNSLAEGSSAHAALSFGVGLEGVEVALEVGEGVGVAVGEVDRVLVELELALPGQGVVVALVLPLHRVLVVADVCAGADPPSPHLPLGSVGVHQGPHAVIVEGVGLDQVDDVEAVVLARLHVGHAEVVPLGVPSRVVVGLENQIVLVLIDLDCSPQVPAFKSRLEDQSVVLHVAGHIEGHDFVFWRTTLIVGRRVN
mmetsp:Transcript_11932/g.20170  ORF Transcript_11932/g.20170 Transcript_11932/m.20170 type:complete len:212 (+) Transcript_11932:949-1584(+)